MKIQLTSDEQEKFYSSILCNGLQLLNGCGLALQFNDNEYETAKTQLEENQCYEDVLLQMLKNGNILKIVDVEGNGEYTKKIEYITDFTIIEGKERFLHFFSEIMNEQDDAWDNFNAMQYILYGDLIFG